MKFWDSSALLPLCLEEPSTPALVRLAREDGELVVWWASRLECLSALARRRREEKLPAAADRQARAALAVLAGGWLEILPGEAVRQRAERLLAVHPLRAADALQLAAALLWCGERPAGAGFVCLDRNLGAAAAREGFAVLP